MPIVRNGIKTSIDYRAVQLFWKHYTKKESYADNRRRANVIIKHSFSSACRIHTTLSLTQIAGIIGKDHASVVHAMKNHESNLQYLPSYAYVFEEMEEGIRNAINREADTHEASKLKEVKQLRSRLIEVSSKLRHKIQQYNDLYESESKKPLRIAEENEILKTYIKSLQARNEKLNKECNRLKNLL